MYLHILNEKLLISSKPEALNIKFLNNNIPISNNKFHG